jgi:putative signal transducing protein
MKPDYESVPDTLRGSMTMKSSDLIAVSTFRSKADAQRAKGILDEAGIESMIQADPTIVNSRYNAPGAFPPGAVTQLMVRGEDVDKASEALHRRHRRSN